MADGGKVSPQLAEFIQQEQAKAQVRRRDARAARKRGGGVLYFSLVRPRGAASLSKVPLPTPADCIGAAVHVNMRAVHGKGVARRPRALLFLLRANRPPPTRHALQARSHEKESPRARPLTHSALSPLLPQIQQTVARVTEVCWDKCVGYPGRSLSSREAGCMADCAKRFIETTQFIVQRFQAKAGSGEGGGGGGGGGGGFFE